MRTFYSVVESLHKHLHGWSHGVDRSLVWNVVGEQELHHFHWQKVQALLGPNDYLRQDQFVRWFVHQCTQKHDFPTMVLFTEETCFTREGIFSYNSHFVQKQTVMQHLFTTTNNDLWSTSGRALLMNSSLGLTCYPDSSVHRFTMCFWRKSYQKCWRKSCCQSGETCGSSMAGLGLTLHVRSENISPPLMIAGLDRVNQWLGLPGHQTSHQWTSLYEATLKTKFTHCQLTFKRILLSVLLKQQQPSGNNMAFMNVR